MRRPGSRLQSRPKIRLAVLATGLGLLAVLGLLVLPVSTTGIRGVVEPFGWFGPIMFVLVTGVLSLTFVPGPLMAAASGILFGTWLGFAVSLVGSGFSAVLALLVARRAGASAVTEISGPRSLSLMELARRRGFLVVVLQRLIPGIPDTPFSYAFGLIGLRVWPVALGSVIGSAPRGFSYTALGSASVDKDGGLALVGLIVGVAVSIIGAVIGWVVLRRDHAAQRLRGGSAASEAADAPQQRD